MCAEPITIDTNGFIKQVEMTTKGLNCTSLVAKGKISATRCCNLSNGKMPHGSIKGKDVSLNTNNTKDRFITNFGKNSFANYNILILLTVTLSELL